MFGVRVTLEGLEREPVFLGVAKHPLPVFVVHRLSCITVALMEMRKGAGAVRHWLPRSYMETNTH